MDGCIYCSLTKDKVVRPEQLPKWARTNRIHGSWFQVHQDGAGDKLVTFQEGSREIMQDCLGPYQQWASVETSSRVEQTCFGPRRGAARFPLLHPESTAAIFSCIRELHRGHPNNCAFLPCPHLHFLTSSCRPGFQAYGSDSRDPEKPPCMTMKSRSVWNPRPASPCSDGGVPTRGAQGMTFELLR